MKRLSDSQYIEALEKLKRSPKDRIGTLGELGVSAIGAAGGVASAGAVAGAAGATTLLGSTTLASVLGGVFVTATPVGWVVGTAVLGATAGYALTRLVRSGAKADAYRLGSIRELEDRIRSLRDEARVDVNEEQQFRRFVTGVQFLVANGRLSQDRASELIAGVHDKSVPAMDAFDLVESLLSTAKPAHLSVVTPR